MAADEADRARRGRGRWLGVVIVISLVMGPGPGSLLVSPGEGEEPMRFIGVPALYAWAVLWFLVMAGAVVLAAKLLWAEEDGE